MDQVRPARIEVPQRRAAAPAKPAARRGRDLGSDITGAGVVAADVLFALDREGRGPRAEIDGEAARARRLAAD